MDEKEFLQELRKTFLDEVEDTLELIVAAFLKFEKAPSNKDVLHEIFRYFHNIKGSSKAVGLSDLSHFAHKAENLLAKLRTGEMTATDEIADALISSADLMADYCSMLKEGSDDASELNKIALTLETFIDQKDSSEPLASASAEEKVQTVEKESFEETPSDGGFVLFGEEEPSKKEPPRSKEEEKKAPKVSPTQKAAAKEEFIKVPMDKINQILDLFGEQVILQSGLDHNLALESLDPDFIYRSISQLKKITQDLQYTMVTLRMVRLESLFNRLERAIRDTSKMTGKKVEFLKSGKSSELDKSIVDALVDPLTHMVRNAVDHGIEDLDTRRQRGKPDYGVLKLSVQRTGGTFEFILSDDGKGLDRDHILATALSKGLVREGENLSDSQIFDFIFQSGFSTVKKATEISGRGVGMDVVRQQIRKLKGDCFISSQKGKGSKFVIRVPLSLAMFNGTVISVNSQRYVIPNSDFSEALTLKHLEYEKNHKEKSLLKVGERVLRKIDLRDYLIHSRSHKASQSDKEEKLLAIVAEFEGRFYALIVNDILSQEQIVLKELGPEGKQIRGASGGTILGDGQVALVLDIPNIIKRENFNAKRNAA